MILWQSTTAAGRFIKLLDLWRCPIGLTGERKNMIDGKLAQWTRKEDNMTFEEYRNRMIEIRRMVNSLIDDMGGTYCNAPEMLEKVLNIAMNGDYICI